MITPTAPDQPICPLGVSERTLSALRDTSVNQDEADRLAAHVANCPACRERLAAFDSLAAILRSERPPDLDGSLWPAITTAATTASPVSVRHPRLFSVRPGAPGAATWSRVGALVAVLLLTVGFIALLSLHRPGQPVQRQATATATYPSNLLPAQPLTWRPVGVSSPQGDIAFANDGKSAYKCDVSDDAQGNSMLNIWRTSDRGALWIPARKVPSVPTANGCQLVVDLSAPSVASLAWQPRGGGAGDSYSGLMTTTDGGVHWQTVPTPPPGQSFSRIDQVHSRDGKIYSIHEWTNSANSVEYHLWVSDNGMMIWQKVDHDIPAPIAGFWLQPDGPGILVVASDGAPGGSSALLGSPDGGATWRSLTVPGGLPPYQTARVSAPAVRPVGIVARWLQGQFHICASRVPEGASTPDLICSTDGGATWQTRPTPPVSASRGAAVTINLVGITNDGALLATSDGVLYRLAASASQWQSLGPLPGAYVFYAPSSGAGVLWAASVPLGEPYDPQGRVFTADYTP